MVITIIYKNKEKLLKLLLISISLAIFFSFGINTVTATNSNIYVSNIGNDTWNGQYSTWQSGLLGPKSTIYNAVNTVTDNGTVYVAKGKYNESNIKINKNVNIQGEDRDKTIIDGEKKDRIFNIVPGVNVKISNLTIINGQSNSYGGAIVNDQSNLTITNVTFTNNTAVTGGAIYNSKGTLNLNNVNFTTNSATNGNGGAIHDYYGKVTVTKNIFTKQHCN